MISIQNDQQTIRVTVGGEVNLADYREFESALLHGLKFEGTLNLLIDLRDMLGYSVDVAWEDLKFSHQHRYEFNRIAIITDSQWLTWSALFYRLFVDADIRTFEDADMAESWLAEGQGQ